MGAGLSSLVGYIPLALAAYSAWANGGHTPLVQYGVTVVVGRLLNASLAFLLKLCIGKGNPRVIAQVACFPAAIVAAGYFLGASLHMLAGYVFSAFVFPGIRHISPTFGPPAIVGAIVSAVAFVWVTDGVSPTFVFIFFLQALPEVQRMLLVGSPWKTRAHVALIAAITTAFLPLALLGAAAIMEPSWLQKLTEQHLRLMCRVSNGCPSVDQRDLYAALGLGRYASHAEVKRAYRSIALANHPDKLLGLQADELEGRVEEFKRATAAYEMLNKPGASALHQRHPSPFLSRAASPAAAPSGAQSQYDRQLRSEGGMRPELVDLVPRGVVTALMLVMWLLQTYSAWRSTTAQVRAAKERFRHHVLQQGPINLRALGLKSREPLENFMKFYDATLVANNDEADLLALRRALEEAGVALDPPDPAVPRTVVWSMRGNEDALRDHLLNGGAVSTRALGVGRDVLSEYARDKSNPLIPLGKNDGDDVKALRERLEAAGLELEPLPAEEDGPLQVIPLG